MDMYLGPLYHQALLASKQSRLAQHEAPNARANPRLEPCSPQEKTDNGDSWVLRKENGEIEPLEGESMLLKSLGHVSFDLKVPQSLRTPNSNFTLKCDDGTLYITNQRVS